MKRLLIILLCLGLWGCAGSGKIKSLKVERQQLQQLILQKDSELEALKAALVENEKEIAEQQVKIEELRKKLEGLGVFEK